MNKILKCIVCIAICVFLIVVPVSAAVDYPTDSVYETYIYNKDMEPVKIPAAFNVSKVLTGYDIYGNEFSGLSDVVYDGNNRIYLCDSAKNCIIVLDKDFKFITLIDGFVFENQKQTFSSLSSLWTDGKEIYIADTDNSRIVVLNVTEDGYTLKNIFNKPNISILDEDYIYKPTRVTVDAVGRIYVVADGINQGLICLDENGQFTNFLGAPKVEFNPVEMLWRKIATKEQLSQMESYVPTEYDSVTIDSLGFLYVTSQTSTQIPVGKLNSNGDNILNAPDGGFYADKGYLEGKDTSYNPYFTDLTLNQSEEIGDTIYYILDSKQGKIYGYTEEGTLIYAFGDNGYQKGTFYNASSIEYIKGNGKTKGKLLVSDSSKKTLTVLEETDFASNIHSALSSYNKGDYDSSVIAWEKVNESAAGYVPAIVGLAKVDAQKGNYIDAMKKLYLVNDYGTYSKYFEIHRENLIRDNFVWILAIVALLIIGILLIKKQISKSKVYKKINDSEIYKGYKYGTYVMLHPFDGFWDLKHEKRGNMKSALTIIVLFFLLYALRLQFSGYSATGIQTDNVNVLYNVALLFLPLCFYVISNWCFTSLMDGKGTMKDIIIATAYALKPYVLVSLPMLVCSHFISASEVAFYNIINIISIVWVILLLFLGLMVTHDYSLSKSIITTILVLIGITLIIFILLLFVYIIKDVYQFFYNIIQELSYRQY